MRFLARDKPACAARPARIAVAVSIAVASMTLVPTLGSRAAALPEHLKVQTFKGNLDFPIDMAWVKGTRKFFFTEKNTGKVRVVLRGRVLPRACVNLAVNANGERGALGIVLHPAFKRTHFLYVFFTKAAPLENRVMRFRVQGNRCTNPKPIARAISASGGYHNGGQLEFMAGKLFVSTGEAHDPANAQDKSNRLGKILRYNPDGTIPATNPFNTARDRNPVWSYGLRNPFGLAHRPGTWQLFATDNGPECDDELNRIRKRRNYGWGPGYNCGTSGVGPNPKAPMRRWTPPIVPTDATWYRGSLRSLAGSLYVGDFANGRLHRFTLGRRGARIIRHRVILDLDEGILDVSTGPRGLLYVVTRTRILRIMRR